jgi:hypothetical protein
MPLKAIPDGKKFPSVLAKELKNPWTLFFVRGEKRAACLSKN